jgi:Protein kinase domain
MLTAGACLGPFILIRRLGKGAFGETWLVERSGIVRVPLAVKVLRLSVQSEALAKEAATLLRLAHPHIVPIIEADRYACDAQSYFALVMTYEAGGDLRRRLVPQGLGPCETTRYASGVLDALAYAHVNRVVHRDVKPENVLLRGGEAVLGDFGLAAEIDMRSVVDGVQGTVPYIAPEIWISGQAGAPADIWAFGIMLHEMVVGVRPFSSHNMFELQRAVTQKEPAPLPPHVPAVLANIIRAALKKDPRKRPKASELLAELGHDRTPSIQPGLREEPLPVSVGKGPGFSPAVPCDRRVDLQLAAHREPELAKRLAEWKGKSIGPYCVLGMAGIGGQAIVLLAKGPRENEVVAIKLPRLPYTAPATFGLAEVRAARTRLQRGWVQGMELYGAGVTALARPITRIVAPNPLHVQQRAPWVRDEETYYVEEWVNGLTLDELGVLLHSDEQWHAHLERVVSIVARDMFVYLVTLARAVPPRVYIDMAPRNFMFDQSWRVRVVDVAALEYADLVPPRPPVTPSYLEVENARAWQSQAAIHIDRTSALHGLGRILYRLVTNRLPLAGVAVDLNDAKWQAYPHLLGLASGLLQPTPDEAALQEFITTWETRS